MQILICPGYHSSELTHSFVQSLRGVLTPERLWVLPIWASPALPWLLTAGSLPQQDWPLHIIAFSAGVVAAYPFALVWQGMGGTVRMIAVDGWGMPLVGLLSVYRMSHDRWTHRTTYCPSSAESRGYFYAHPAVDHLSMWRSPQLIGGLGTTRTMSAHSMTALEFIYDVLTRPDEV